MCCKKKANGRILKDGEKTAKAISACRTMAVASGLKILKSGNCKSYQYFQ